MRAHFRKTLVAAVGVTLLGATAACGGSTVDNEDVDQTTVPSVSSSASADKEDADKAKDDKDKDPESKGEPGERGSTSSGAESDVRDGSVKPVEEIPSGAEQRSAGDEKFLDALEDHGLDLSKEDPETKAALQNQIIAAGYEFCGDENTPLIGVAAGQLQAQGLLGKAEGDNGAQQQFENTVNNIQAAAGDHLCD